MIFGYGKIFLYFNLHLVLQNEGSNNVSMIIMMISHNYRACKGGEKKRREVKGGMEEFEGRRRGMHGTSK